MSRKEFNMEAIAEKFNFKGIFKEFELNEAGHINDTYIVVYDDNGTRIRYILQRVNTDIFGNPKELMSNIVAVTNHIEAKVLAEGGDIEREVLRVVKTKDGQAFYKNNEDCFRAFYFIENVKTYQKVEKPEHMYMTGKALGKFQKQLGDFNVETLFDIIPNFHNTYKRYNDFMASVKLDEFDRVKNVLDEIEFIEDRKEDMKIIVELLDNKKLPLRVTHNDTKFNNILIDIDTDKAIALIDLDTVMSGSALYDFGDAIRSGATTALEDEIDLDKVNFDMNLFEEFTKGYLKEMKDILSESEIEYLAFSSKLITLELAMRFLGDYLNGDIYFKVERENHNLDRARNQLKLVSDIEISMEEMNKIVKSYL